MTQEKENTKPKEEIENDDQSLKTDTPFQTENTRPEENEEEIITTDKARKWLKQIQDHPIYILIIISGVLISFFFKTLPPLFESSSDTEKTSGQSFGISKNKKWSEKIQITYPELSGKNDSIEKIIVNKVISYLEKGEPGKYKTYEDLDYFLDNHQYNNPDSLFMNVVIHEDRSKGDKTGLTEYLYISFIRLAPSRKDTLSVDFINYDTKEKRELKLNDLFLGVSILKQLVEEKFREKLNIEKSFVDGLFHLSPNFLLTDKAIEFHYFHKKGDEWARKQPFKLIVPYDDVKSVIDYKSKLKFLRNKTN